MCSRFSTRNFQSFTAFILSSYHHKLSEAWCRGASTQQYGTITKLHKKKSSISALRPLNHYVCGESAYILAQLSNMGLFSTVAFCLSWVSPLIVVYIVSPIPAIVHRSLFRVGIELSLGRTVCFRDRFTDVPYSCHFIMTSLYFFSALGIFCTELSRALRN